MAFDVVVRAFFTDSGLSAGLAKANDQLKQLGRSGPNAGQGVRAVETGVRMLAFQAVGLPGPLGKIASGFLQLSGGNALVLSVVAGMAIAGAAIRALTKDARDNAAAQKAMTDELAKIGPHGEARAADIEIDRLQALQRLPLGERLKRVGKASLGLLPGGETLEEQNQKIERQIAEQVRRRNRALDRLADPAQQARRAAGGELAEARLRRDLSGNAFDQAPATAIAAAEAVRRLRLEHEHINPAIAATIAATERHAAEVMLATDAISDAREGTFEATLRNRMLGASEDAVTEALRRHKLELQGMPAAVATAVAGAERLAAASIKTANVLRTQLPAAFAAMGAAATESMSAVVRSAIQSVAQIAQSLPGIGPVESGVIGLISGILGGIFGRSRDRGVTIDEFSERALAQQRNNGGDPDRFTLQLISSSTGEMIDEIVYELGRRTRLDRVIRIPRGVVIRR